MGFLCPWWDCQLENVSEYQQAECEKNGMNCNQCMKCAAEEEMNNETDPF